MRILGRVFIYNSVCVCVCVCVYWKRVPTIVGHLVSAKTYYNINTRILYGRYCMYATQKNISKNLT